MFELIFNDMALALKSTDLFDEVYPIAENILVGDGNMYPVITVGKDEKQHLPYDFKNSFAYLKKQGRVTFAKPDAPSITSCEDDLYTLNVPVRVVAFVNKNMADCINGFEDFALAEKIMSQMPVKINIDNANSCTVNISALETDRESVVKSEYKINDFNGFNFNYSHIMLDYNVRVTGTLSCLNNCNNYNYQS